MIIWNDCSSPFNEMMSAAEAAEIWGLEQSTIRKAIAAKKLVEGRDCFKFGKQWVVTAEGMHRWTGNWVPWSEWKTIQRQIERGMEPTRQYDTKEFPIT